MKISPSLPVLVRAVLPGDVLAEPGHLYKVLWLHAERESSVRMLYILPPGDAPDMPHPLAHPMPQNGFLITFPEELLLLSGFHDCYPFLNRSPRASVFKTSVDLTTCAIGQTIERTISGLHDECQQSSKGHLLISGLLKILLVSVSRIFRQPDHADTECNDQQLFQRFMALVAGHNVSKKGMQDYAKALSTRSDVLSDAIKRVTGYPASHHIYQHIIRTAKHAAIGSGSSMKEVAYGLGFKDVAHFSKFFRNKAGMTFSDYKKAYQGL